MLNVAGKVVASRSGAGPAHYAFPVPVEGGIYAVEMKAGGRTRVQRVTVL